MSDTKKETSVHFFCEVEDTPKYVAHVTGGAMSTKYRHLPRTEMTDNRVFRETGGHYPVEFEAKSSFIYVAIVRKIYMTILENSYTEEPGTGECSLPGTSNDDR